jgi:hypothetical protein
MGPNTDFTTLASDEQITKTMQALEANGMHAIVVENSEEARQRVLDLLPEGAEVFTARSRTIESMGLDKAINESPRFDSVRNRMLALDPMTQRRAMAKLSAAPDIVVGSVHAITEDGEVVTASFGGSQLSSYASGAGKVIWVVGTQKLVATLDDGIRRIYKHSLPLEDARLRATLGRGSAVGKVLVVNQEPVPDRITVVLVKENLGF